MVNLHEVSVKAPVIKAKVPDNLEGSALVHLQNPVFVVYVSKRKVLFL
jgi:hypothetical protein